MKHLRKLLIALLGGIIMTGMLAGCTKSVEDEFKPLFEVLEQQKVETSDLVSINEYLDAFGQDYNKKGFELTLSKNESGTIEGTYIEINGSQSIDVTLVDGQDLFQTGERDIFFKNLLLKDFHFSSDYFKHLKLEETYDSFERYDKGMIYKEIQLSDYSKALQKEYNLSDNLDTMIEINKTRGSEKSFNYFLIYYLFDRDNHYSIRRTFVIELENTYD